MVIVVKSNSDFDNMVTNFDYCGLKFKFNNDRIIIERINKDKENVSYKSTINLKILKEIKLIHEGRFRDYIMSFIVAGSICECLLKLGEDIKDDLDNDEFREKLKCFIGNICKTYGIKVLFTIPSMTTSIKKLSNRYTTYFLDENVSRYNGYKMVNMRCNDKVLKYLISFRLNKLFIWNDSGKKVTIKYESMVVNDIFSNEVHLSILYAIMMLYSYNLSIRKDMCDNESVIDLDCDEFIKYLI